MLKKEIVTITWSSRTKTYYEKLGYKFTKFGDKFYINVKHLSINSAVKVDVVCDYCGKEIQKRYQSYIKGHHKKFGDCCNDCKLIKQREIMQHKYGVSYAVHIPGNTEKRQQTCVDKYGTISPTYIHQQKYVEQ